MKQDDLIKIAITKKNRKSKDGKKKWTEFRTPLMLLVKGEEEKGKQEKWLTVVFAEEINTKDLSRGLLTVKVSDVSFPKVYEITKTEDGKDKYPRVYINAYSEFRPVELEVENPFVTDKFETNEQETEEVEVEENTDDNLLF